MKILPILLITIFTASLIFVNHNAFANNSASVGILILGVQPSTIKVGDKFTVTTTFANNSPNPVLVENGVCDAPFSVAFDSHVLVRKNDIYCTLQLIVHRIDPGMNMTFTGPGSEFSYMAENGGPVNATITFPYKMWSPKNQSYGQESVSKSFLFTIYNNTSAATLNYGRHPVINQIDSPLKQFKSGIKAEDVRCSTSFILATKIDYSPACVKESSAIKLFLRGWAIGFPHYGTVYFVKPNSNAWISVKYSPRVYDTTIPIPDIAIHLYSRIYDPKSGASPATNEINVTAKPDFVHTSSNTVVNYTINTGNTRGVYWLSILDPCVLIPITVDLDESKLNMSELELQNPGNAAKCPAPEVQFHVVGISNGVLNLIPDIKATSYEKSHGGPVALSNQTEPAQTLPASFMPCDTPFPKSNSGVATLYLPMNSVGKICVRYSNINDIPALAGIRISNANNLTGEATEISTWNDLGGTTIPKGNSTVVYWIKTGNQSGFYGLTIFCVPVPLAVGYDNDSRIVAADFPWFGKQFECPMQSYDFHIDSLTGIGVKYIPYP